VRPKYLTLIDNQPAVTIAEPSAQTLRLVEVQKIDELQWYRCRSTANGALNFSTRDRPNHNFLWNHLHNDQSANLGEASRVVSAQNESRWQIRILRAV